MIASISGTIRKIGKDHLIIVVGGVGLYVNVPRTVLEDAGAVGRSVHLHTHLIVRETELALYGFDTEDDLHLFEQLIGVPRVGPKLALAILSTLSPELLRSAVLQEEAMILQRVPGIGKKSAEQIMFALRGKLGDQLTSSVGLVSDVDTDVVEVLTTLGFSIVEAQSALQNIPRDARDVETRVSYALQYLDQRR